MSDKIIKLRVFCLKNLLRLLGMAGFSMLVSCTKYGAPIAEYGIISSDYLDFHGRVVSGDSLQPIQNIKVKLSFQPDDTLTTRTDIDGNYSIHHYAGQGQTGTLVFTDTDSIQNGSFYQKNVMAEVSFRDMNNLEHEANVELKRKP